jgi:hypothetical protein
MSPRNVLSGSDCWASSDQEHNVAAGALLDRVEQAEAELAYQNCIGSVGRGNLIHPGAKWPPPRSWPLPDRRPSGVSARVWIGKRQP